jgi:hypothetical protein
MYSVYTKGPNKGKVLYVILLMYLIVYEVVLWAIKKVHLYKHFAKTDIRILLKVFNIILIANIFSNDLYSRHFTI